VKYCIDCKNCKVSSVSTRESRMCFCSLSRAKDNYFEEYWQTKIACKKFFDMTEKPMTLLFPVISLERRPLMKIWS
jgi:hypothetical protein